MLPTLAGAQYREIAKFAQVGLGTIGPVLKDLTQRGYLQKAKTPAGALVRRKELLNEWVTNYPVRQNGMQVLRDAAAVYKVDIDAIAAKVRQEFAAKEKAKLTKRPTAKAAPTKMKKTA
ncbi:MAG TPA: hypothetical protein VGB94_01910 [Acidobacteriaceae bacterium]